MTPKRLVAASAAELELRTLALGPEARTVGRVYDALAEDLYGKAYADLSADQRRHVKSRALGAAYGAPAPRG